MKTFVRIAAIAGGLFFAGTSFAQEKKETMAKPATTATAHTDDLRPLPIAHMKDELKLTDDQMTKLKEAEANAQKEKGALDAKLTPEERSAKMRDIMMRRDKAVDGILTPEQNKQWSASRREGMKKAATTESKPAEKK